MLDILLRRLQKKLDAEELRLDPEEVSE